MQFLILLSLFSGLTLAATPDGTVLERTEASVNSSLILLSDIENFRKTIKLREQLDPLFAGSEIAKKASRLTDAEIVNFLIDEKIILQQFPVNDTETEQEINSIQANNRIDRNSLKAALKEQGFSFQDYFELIRVSATKRNLIDRDIRTRVSISEQDIKNFYYNRYEQGSSTPLLYKVRIITINPKNYRNTRTAQDTSVRAMEALKSGEAFEEVAKRLSDDPSATSGGDLGLLKADHLNKQLAEAIKRLKIGETSAILGSEASQYFILKLEDIQSEENTRYEKMKEEIRSQLASSEYQNQIALWLERQRSNAFIHRKGEQ